VPYSNAGDAAAAVSSWTPVGFSYFQPKLIAALPGISVDNPSFPARFSAGISQVDLWVPPQQNLIAGLPGVSVDNPSPRLIFPFSFWRDDGSWRDDKTTWSVLSFNAPQREIQPGPPIPPPPLTAAYAIIQLSFGYSARVQPAAPPFISTITSGDTVSWLVFFYAVTGRLVNPAVATLSIVYGAARGQFSFMIPLANSPLNGWSASWTALPSFGGGVANWTISVPNSAMPPQSGVVYVTNFRRI
jgi:hypothetical protein